MRIIGVLSWYDESEAWLAQCVASAARCCDHLVAVDGAYHLFPGGRARSPWGQAEAVIGACEAAGVGVTLHRPDSVWYGNEVEKRNHSLALARTCGGPDDWLLVLDADCVVSHVGEMLRSDLEQADTPVAVCDVIDSLDPGASEAMTEFVRTHMAPANWVTKGRLLYRNLDDLAYGPRHYLLSATWQGERAWLWGHPEYHDNCLDACDVGQQLLITHRNRFRAAERMSRAGDYYRLRDELEIEPLRRVHMETTGGDLGVVA